MGDGATNRRMAPVRSWSEQDYYTASRAARAAWEAKDQQLTLGVLESDGVKRAESEPAATPSDSSAPVAPPHILPAAGVLDTPTNGGSE